MFKPVATAAAVLASGRRPHLHAHPWGPRQRVLFQSLIPHIAPAGAARPTAASVPPAPAGQRPRPREGLGGSGPMTSTECSDQVAPQYADDRHYPRKEVF